MENNQNEILKKEEEILKEEKEILKEIKKEGQLIKTNEKKILYISIGAVVVIIIAILGGLYFYNASKTVYIDKAEISAPVIELAASTSGVLEDIFVNEGDQIGAHIAVARIGNELIKSTIAGTILSTHENIGKIFTAGTPVVTMIDPNSLRVTGHLEEDKGLQYVQVGQLATFTVDAFGTKQFYGTVDEVAPSGRQGDVVFNISSQRPTNEFDVKIRYDFNLYPELKSGMSARIWITK